MRRLAMMALLLIGCTDEEGSMRALRSMGFKQIQLTGYRFTGCGDESQHTGFVARGADGATVEGVVCCGFTPWSKGCTVRLD